MPSNRAQRTPLSISTHDLTMTNRRRFLLQCSVVVTVAAVPGAGLCSPMRFRDLSLDRIGFSTFSRLVGTHFHVYQSLSPVKLELVEASPGRDGRDDVLRRGSRQVEPEEFSLIFRGAKDQPLGQDSYPFAHEQIGRFVMFIVPVWDLADVTGARFYEAAFNRPAGLATPRI